MISASLNSSLSKRRPTKEGIKLPSVIMMESLLSSPGRLQEELISDVIQEHPEVCKYVYHSLQMDLYPLAILCKRNPSLDIVQLTYKAYPPAVRHADKEGWLPLYYAVRHEASFPVVQFLVYCYPQSLQHKDVFGWPPLYLAKRSNATPKVLQLLDFASRHDLSPPNLASLLHQYRSLVKQFRKQEHKWMKQKYKQALKQQQKGELPNHLPDFNPQAESDFLLAREELPATVSQDQAEHARSCLDFLTPIHSEDRMSVTTGQLTLLQDQHPEFANLLFLLKPSEYNDFARINQAIRGYVKEHPEVAHCPLEITTSTQKGETTHEMTTSTLETLTEHQGNMESSSSNKDSAGSSDQEEGTSHNKRGTAHYHKETIDSYQQVIETTDVVTSDHDIKKPAKQVPGESSVVDTATLTTISSGVVVTTTHNTNADHDSVASTVGDNHSFYTVNALMWLCQRPQAVELETLQVVYRANPDAVQKLDSHGWSGLHLLCEQVQYQPAIFSLIRFLAMVHPASLQSPEKFGRWALHVACACRAPLVVIRFLVEQCPQALRQVDEFGWLPLHFACRYKAGMDVVQYLVEQDPISVQRMQLRGWLPLHYAAVFCESAPMVHYLTNEYPMGVQTACKFGRLPLHCAAACRAKPSAIYYMLKKYAHGAFVKERQDGWLPLHWACRYHYPDCLAAIQCLVVHNPHSAASEDTSGLSPLDLARKYQAPKPVIQLLDLACRKPDLFQDVDLSITRCQQQLMSTGETIDQREELRARKTLGILQPVKVLMDALQKEYEELIQKEIVGGLVPKDRNDNDDDDTSSSDTGSTSERDVDDFDMDFEAEFGNGPSDAAGSRGGGGNSGSHGHGNKRTKQKGQGDTKEMALESASLASTVTCTSNHSRTSNWGEDEDSSSHSEEDLRWVDFSDLDELHPCGKGMGHGDCASTIGTSMSPLMEELLCVGEMLVLAD